MRSSRVGCRQREVSTERETRLSVETREQELQEVSLGELIENVLRVQSEKAKAVRFSTSVEQEKKLRVGGEGADRTEVAGQIATGERGWSGGREDNWKHKRWLKKKCRKHRLSGAQRQTRDQKRNG
jgi:hypothetical protein